MRGREVGGVDVKVIAWDEAARLWGEASEAARAFVERMKAPTAKMIRAFTDLVDKIRLLGPSYPRGWKRPTPWLVQRPSRTYPRHLPREIPTIHEIIGLSYPTGPDPPVASL